MKLAWPWVSVPGTLEVPRLQGDDSHCLGRCEGAGYSWLFGKLCEPCLGLQGGGRPLPTHPCLEGPLGCETSGFITALAPAQRQNPGRVTAQLGSTS